MKFAITPLRSAVFMFGLISSIHHSMACTRLGPVIVRNTCHKADFIVRATALGYSLEPRDTSIRTTGVPDSKVLFKIEEILKGDTHSGTIELNGYLSDQDDFNDHPAPYNFVRRGGRHGSCFANTYKKGAQFLLCLRRSDAVKWPGATTPFTVNIDPLAPVNEQLHSPDDPWVYHIKGLIEGLKSSSDPGKINK